MILHSHLKSILQWSSKDWADIHHQLRLSICSHLRVTSCARRSIILTENTPKICRQDEELKKLLSFLNTWRIYRYPHHPSGDDLVPSPRSSGPLKILSEWQEVEETGVRHTVALWSNVLSSAQQTANPAFSWRSYFSPHRPGRNKIAKHDVNQVGGAQARK